MKYKIGDKVRIKKDLVVGREIGNDYYVREMDELARERNYIFTIMGYNDDCTAYVMFDDEYVCNWTEEMVDGLAEKEPTDREKFEGWMRKLSKLDSKDDTWKAFDRLTYLEADRADDKKEFEKSLKLVADYLFGVGKKKMTKAEIEKELGYKIEIVEGE